MGKWGIAAISAGAGAIGAALVISVVVVLDTNRMVADALADTADLRRQVSDLQSARFREQIAETENGGRLRAYCAMTDPAAPRREMHKMLDGACAYHAQIQA